jgi:hypothetical protein
MPSKTAKKRPAAAKKAVKRTPRKAPAPAAKAATKTATQREKWAEQKRKQRGTGNLRRCPECGKELTANNLSRHIQSRHPGAAIPASPGRSGRPPGPLPTEVRASMAETRRLNAIITEYDEFLRSGGNAVNATVTISGVDGFNNGKYNDPAKVDAAIEVLREKAKNEGPGVKRILLVQRIHNLVSANERLRAMQNGSNPEKQFIEIAAEWSIQNGVDYAAWRDAGVPPRVLKAAGINR